MKRNSTTKKIISLILTAIMICSCWVFAPIEADAATAETRSAGFPRGDDPNRHHGGFGLNPGKGVSGTLSESPANSLFFLNSSYNELAYCIEIGVPVDENSAIETADETSACNTLASRLNSSANASKVSMSGARMKMLLRSILGYGYQHDGSIMTEWMDIVGNAYQRENFSYAYATQMLVWELTSGERNANFDHVGVPDGYMSIYNHCIKPSNPLKGYIDKYYRQIEANVKSSTPTLDPSITDKNFTLKPNEATKKMEVEIPDANGVFKNTTSILGLSGVSIKHEDGKLKISVPYIYAKEGGYQLPYTIKHREPKEIQIYLPSHSQDMITATGGITEVNETGSINLIIPHHHEWMPHLILPTCTTEGLTCMMCKCGNIYTESITSPLGHNTNSPWVVGHKATCTEDGEEVQICERCNIVINSRPITKTGHNEVWIIETEPTANQDGQMVSYCTKCGNRTNTKSFGKHTHELGYEAVVRDATCITEGRMGKFCKECGVCYDTSTISAGHSETLIWVTTIQPTCTSDGESTAYCGDCGDIVSTKSVEATGHSNGIWMTSISPYCGLKGEEICLCDQCGEIIDTRETDALSHDEGVWKIKNDPTCELAGEKVKSCTRCGQVIETEAISVLGHDEGVWKIDIEATADLDGLMGRYCTRCSMVLETKEFTLHTHEEGYTTTLLQATCTRGGEKGAVCKICNAVYNSETVPMLNHDYSAFYTESNGTHSKSCSRCHYVYTENCSCEIIESYEATCTTSGYEISKCIVCAYTYSDSFVAPYGHTFGKWATEGKSTHMRYCTECGVMEISKHVWGEYFSNNDGDFIEEGSKTRSCIYCGESQTIGKPADILVTVLDTTFSLMQFALLLYESKDAFMDFLMNFIEFIKNLF